MALERPAFPRGIQLSSFTEANQQYLRWEHPASGIAGRQPAPYEEDALAAAAAEAWEALCDAGFAHAATRPPSCQAVSLVSADESVA